MAKTNLNTTPLHEVIGVVKLYHRDKYKKAFFGHGDPYLNERVLHNRFIVHDELADAIINYLSSLANRYAPYVQHFK